VRALVTAAACALTVDRPIAQRLAEQAVELARQLDDDSLLVLSQGLVGAAHYFAGDLETASALARDCVERARPLGDGTLLRETLLLSCLCSQAIDSAATEALYGETIALAQRSGDLLLTADIHNHAGIRALEAGNLTAAREHLERAANASRELGAAPHYANVNLGMLLREEGDRNGARSMLEDALRASRRTGDRSGLAYSSLGLACLAGDLAEWRRSAQLHGAAQAFLDQMGHPWLRYDQIRQASIDMVRAGLGEHEFQRSYAAGRGLNFGQAIDLALPRAESARAAVAVPDGT
jgi:tetratricopeptide (TPR) repeat protein